jgi:PPM family protein phosphatase
MPAYAGPMEVAYRTEVGHVRQRNEDALLARPERGLLAVADGLGGHPAGDVASMAAIRSLDEGGLTGESSEDELLDAIRAAHDAVVSAGNEDESRLGLGTTVVVGLVRDAAVTVAHVGDSRAYVIGPSGQLEPVTRDHSVQGYLTQALGLDREVAADLVLVPTPPGTRLLLCTDGLTNMVEDAVIGELLAQGSAQDACDALVKAALDAGGIDNVTVVVVAF